MKDYKNRKDRMGNKTDWVDIIGCSIAILLTLTVLLLFKLIN